MNAVEAGVTRGIALALAELSRDGVVQLGAVECVLRGAGITLGVLRAAGTCARDIDTLRPHLERRRRRSSARAAPSTGERSDR